MFNRTIFLLAAAFSAVALAQPPSVEIRQVEVTPELRFRAQSFARKNTPIFNPIPWVQFRDMIKEGSRVQKGDIVFQLDVQVVKGRIEDLENRIAEAENDAAQRLANLQKTVSQLEDQRSEKLDSKAIQEARKTYLESLPIQADIEIAKGRLEVAQKKLQADEEELAKSRMRLEKGLISPSMLLEDENKVAEQQARTLYAQQMLRLAEVPAHPKQIEIVEFRIRNLELEIKKLESEIPTQEKILEIETATQQRKIEDLRSQLEERREEITHEFLTAPADGVLMYAPQFKRDLISGGKANKGKKLAEIPLRESMALEGEIPEQLRHLFAVGDPAEIKLNMYPNRIFSGKIHEIAPYSRDAIEGDTSSGVKVVDVIVEIDEIPEDLPLGVYGWVTLSTRKPVSGWAVPATWIRYRGGKPHVSVRGMMEPVNGILHEEQFVFSSPHPPIDSIVPEGDWPETEETGIHYLSDRFISTGELTPFESVLLGPPRMRAWDLQIAWLGPENIRVEKDTVLLRVDSERTTEDLENRKMDLQRYQSERESAEEELSIRESEKDFQLGSAQNRIEIRKRERDLVFSSGNSSQIIQSNMNRSNALLQLEKAKTQLARIQRNAEWSSENELKKAKRDLKRRELEYEKTTLLFKQANEGASALDRSTAELALLEEAATVAELQARHHQRVTSIKSNLRWRRARERKAKERLERRQQDIAAFEVKAPVAGLVKYLKAWDGVRQSKIKSGMKVWPGMNLISLSSADKLFVEVQVPERYIQHIKPDLQVSVRIPSEGGMQWNGHVIDMNEILEPATQATNNQSLYGNQETTQEQVLTVRVLIETAEGTELKPGAIAQIIFPFEK